MLSAIKISLLSVYIMTLTLNLPGLEQDFNKERIDVNPLITAYYVTQSEIEEVNVNNWGKIENEFKTMEDLKKLVFEGYSIIGIEKNEIQVVEENAIDEYRMVKGKGFINDNIYIEIYAHSIKYPGDLDIEPDSYMILDAVIHGSYEELDTIKKSFTKVMDYLDIESEISYCISSTIEGEITEDEREIIINNVFKSIKAEPTNGVKDSMIISKTGYSPLIKNNINLMGQKVNVNVATRYSDYDNKTYFWIGTPIISLEY